MLEDKKEKAKSQIKEREIEAHSKAQKYHMAFVQNEAGKEILDGLVRDHCMKPISNPDATLFSCGVAEGKRQLIASILDQIAFSQREI